MVDNILVAGALALVHTVCHLKDSQINIRHSHSIV